MNQVKVQRANKEYSCDKCGGVIKKSELYYKVGDNLSMERRCKGCPPEKGN